MKGHCVHVCCWRGKRCLNPRVLRLPLVLLLPRLTGELWKWCVCACGRCLCMCVVCVCVVCVCCVCVLVSVLQLCVINGFSELRFAYWVFICACTCVCVHICYICYLNGVIVRAAMRPIVKCEIDLHYGALACLEGNSLASSGYCQASSRSQWTISHS